MNKDSMNTGVQIILDRMDTNPEEFEMEHVDKWGDIIHAIHARVEGKVSTNNLDTNKPLRFLTDPEVRAMYDKLEDVRRENFTADVLRRLAETPVQEDLFIHKRHP